MSDAKKKRRNKNKKNKNVAAEQAPQDEVDVKTTTNEEEEGEQAVLKDPSESQMVEIPLVVDDNNNNNKVVEEPPVVKEVPPSPSTNVSSPVPEKTNIVASPVAVTESPAFESVVLESPAPKEKQEENMDVPQSPTTITTARTASSTPVVESSPPAEKCRDVSYSLPSSSPSPSVAGAASAVPSSPSPRSTSSLAVEQLATSSDRDVPLTLVRRKSQSPWTEKAMLIGFWQRDADAPDCNTCGAPFSFFRRRHHCRRCGLVFCAECSAKKAIIPVFPDLVRVCNFCSDELQNALEK